MRRPALLLLSLLILALLLTACAAQTAAPTVDRGPWTVTPTVYRPPSTVYPPPSTVTSTITRPPSTVTPSPEPITLAKTFGLTGDALNAFAGAEKLITRAENGDYLVTASVRNPETGELKEVQYALDPASFNIHPEITNPLGLDTLQAKDADGNPVTLLWLPETHEFRLAYDLLPIVDLNTIGTEKPKAIKENLASIPEIPIEDIQNGLAARSVLLAMERDGYKPFSDGVIERYKNTPPGSKGSSLYFEQQPDGSKVVWLKHRADDKLPITLNDSATKITPYFFRTRIGEQTYDIAALAWFDPKDPENPKPEEFKLIFAAPFSIGGGRNYTLEDFTTTNAFSSNKPLLIKWAGIYGENLNPQNPELALLAQLLQIKGNDAMNLPLFAYPLDQTKTINWGPNNPVAEWVFAKNESLPFELQLMLFLFEVGVAQ